MSFRSIVTFAALMSSSAAMAVPSQEQLDAALAEVKAEKKVIDASWQNPSIPSLLAGVHDNGSSRDGYASYLCLVMADHGINGAIVRVMDVSSKDWKELGKANCQ